MHGKANKIKGFIIAAMLIGAAVVWNYGQQDATAQQRPAPTPQNIGVQPIGEEQVSEEQLRTIRNHPKILEAVEVLAAQGEELDYSKARATKFSPPAPNEKAPRRPIIIIIIIKSSARAAVGRKPEYGKLVYEKGADGQELVYFDEPSGSKPVMQDSTDNVRLGCGAWSAWAETGRNCRNLYLRCIPQNQQAWFVSYQRTRQCRRGPQTQTQTVKLRCGC